MKGCIDLIVDPPRLTRKNRRKNCYNPSHRTLQSQPRPPRPVHVRVLCWHADAAGKLWTQDHCAGCRMAGPIDGLTHCCPPLKDRRRSSPPRFASRQKLNRIPRLKSGQHLRHTHPRSDGLRRVDEQQAWDLGCLVFGTCPSPPTRFGGTRITGFACVHMFAAWPRRYDGAGDTTALQLARQVWLSLPHEGFLAWLGGGGSRRHLTYW